MTTNEVNTLNNGVYIVYDCVLKQFDLPVVLPESKVDDYFKLVVNDPSSKYFNHETDFILNKIGDFDNITGEIISHFVERVKTLDFYVDNQKRKLQTIIQTLNFLPSGYFKMPAELKQDIQQKIDETIKIYVEDYVVPDIDVNKTVLSS